MNMEKKCKKRKGQGKNKGSSFERVICKQLSLWWTQNEKEPRDDVFWRTAGSGARAKVRSKNKQKTFGQYGDIQAIDPVGQPLIDLCTIELKRGYSSETLANLIETHQNPKTKPCFYERFIEQAITDCQLREDESEWILIVKRDRREAILLTSVFFYDSIPIPVDKIIPKFPMIKIRIKLKYKWRRIIAMRLNDFLSQITPAMIERVLRWKMRKKRTAQ